MTPYDFGDVVLVPFPFTNQQAFKKRPAVIVSNRSYNLAKPDVIIMAITSQIRPNPAAGDFQLTHWQNAGLLKPSAIKPIFATLERQLILTKLGALDPQDQSALRITISSILG
ncbi:mRNA interferase MazF [Silvibacterium bohemicum]|uniref:mRNA interferase MazF n=1 Tax=Silvibacterium bohemicum TaxID=1577686 RepID=A0A841JUI9_9BACT|nr:type II toxin-antitoxin system PemK/MazF family toxin [Silvibacterium bohemicum]MBB6145063.1 mRNA interferase MazF [Silvibacterium bohemicum]